MSFLPSPGHVALAYTLALFDVERGAAPDVARQTLGWINLESAGGCDQACQRRGIIRDLEPACMLPTEVLATVAEAFPGFMTPEHWARYGTTHPTFAPEPLRMETEAESDARLDAEGWTP